MLVYGVRRRFGRAGRELAKLAFKAGELTTDIWVDELARGVHMRPHRWRPQTALLVQDAFDGQFSPDGRWVALTSGESGKAQVYVVSFDATKVLNTGPGFVTNLGVPVLFQ